MTVISVNSTAGLISALKSAHGGDTVQLASGTYSGVVVTGANFSQDVTITSADASKPAVLSGLALGNSSGLVFSHVGLTTVGVSDPYYAFRLTGDQNITFSYDDIHGDTTKLASANINGFDIAQSGHITIANSDIHSLNNGVALTNDQYFNFINNVVTEMDKGGVQLAAASEVNITGNTFTNFQVGAGAHSDAVQYTTVGTTAGSKDINISNNVMSRGAGDAYQGILVQDEVGTLPYHNVTVTHNVITGGMWNSILINTGVTGTLDVSNNDATSWAGLNKAGTGSGAALTATTFSTVNFQAMIDLQGNFSGATVTETGNVAQKFLVNGVGTTPTGNALVGALDGATTSESWVQITAPTAHADVIQYGAVSGDVLTGATGTHLYLADLGAGTRAQQQVTSSGLTVQGQYGTLTVHEDGTYAYSETKTGLVAGQTYVDHFTTTVGSADSAAPTPSTLDITVTGSSIGDGGRDVIYAAPAGSVISGFGGGSTLVGGAGHDVFTFDSTSALTTSIKSMGENDVIDLSHLGALHMVQNFDGHAGEVELRHVGTGNWVVYADSTGDKIPDLSIYISSSTNTLTQGNFIL